MIRLAAALLLFAVGASAQTPVTGLDTTQTPPPAPRLVVPPPPGPRLVIETAGPGVVLVNGVDVGLGTVRTDATGSTRSGRSFLAPRRAPGDTVTVTFVDDARAWNARRTDTTVVITGRQQTVRLELPIRTRVETLPLGATLAVIYPSGERREIGQGPADIDLAVGATARVIATLDDHVEAQADLPANRSITLVLPPVGQPDADPVTLLPMRGSTRTRTLIDVGIGAVAAAAGALAIHYKFRADDLDDLYRDETSPRRGEEALLSDINRYDTLSNTALAGMQVGLGVLAFRFILR